MIDKYRALLILIIISLVVTGCSNNLNDTSILKMDRQRVIAEVNGEKILKGELIDNFEQDKLYYGVTEEDEKKAENKEVVNELKNNILEELIFGRIASQRAKKAGYRVNSETISEARKEFEGFITSIAEQMKSEGKDKTLSNIDYIKKARDYVDNQLKAAGRTEEENINIMAEQKAIERFKSDLLKDVHADEDYIIRYYDIQLEMQIHDPEGNSIRDVILYEPSDGVKPERVYTLEEKREDIRRIADEHKKDERWFELLNEWAQESSIKKYSIE